MKNLIKRLSDFFHKTNELDDNKNYDYISRNPIISSDHEQLMKEYDIKFKQTSSGVYNVWKGDLYLFRFVETDRNYHFLIDFFNSLPSIDCYFKHSTNKSFTNGFVNDNFRIYSELELSVTHIILYLFHNSSIKNVSQLEIERQTTILITL